MIYAPSDFSDLHMRTGSDTDGEKYPVIQGYISGYGQDNLISITMEFNVVIEYIPRPVLYQMVERKPAHVSAGA